MGLDINFTKRTWKDLGYFRKVNFLVRFFESRGYEVENIKPLTITKDDITVLIDRCKSVLKDHSLAPSLLPTMSGFFFGSTEYDEYYFGDVQQVLHFCETELLPEFDGLGDNQYITFDIWY